MKTIVLERTGMRPVQFEGELLNKTSTDRAGGQDRSRWHEIALYLTESGDYVLDVVYCTQWQGEIEHHEVIGPTSLEDIDYELRTINPAAHMHTMANDEKANVRAGILAHAFMAAISEVFADLPQIIKED